MDYSRLGETETINDFLDCCVEERQEEKDSIQELRSKCQEEKASITEECSKDCKKLDQVLLETERDLKEVMDESEMVNFFNRRFQHCSRPILDSDLVALSPLSLRADELHDELFNALKEMLTISSSPDKVDKARYIANLQKIEYIRKNARRLVEEAKKKCCEETNIEFAKKDAILFKAIEKIKSETEKTINNYWEKMVKHADEYNDEYSPEGLRTVRDELIPNDIEHSHCEDCYRLLPVAQRTDEEAIKINERYKNIFAGTPYFARRNCLLENITPILYEEYDDAGIAFIGDGPCTWEGAKIFKHAVYSFLCSYPVGFGKIVAIDDCPDSPLASSFMSDIANIEKGELLYERVMNSSAETVCIEPDQIGKVLDSLFNRIRIINDALKTDYRDIFDYNKENPKNPHFLVLLLIRALPSKDGKTIQRLKHILKGGPKCGIIPILYLDRKQAADQKNAAYKEFIDSLTTDELAQTFEISRVRPLSCRNGFSESAFYYALQKRLENDKSALPLESILEDNKIEDYGRTITIPLGHKDGKAFSVGFGIKGEEKCGAHAFVIGTNGSGKTALLQTLLLSAAYKYSPAELEINIFDFKHGHGFNHFCKLPHVRYLSVNQGIDDAIDVVDYLTREKERRSKLFAGLSDIEEYNKQALRRGERKLPRMFVVIDEIERLWQNSNCWDGLREIAKQGRSFGISLILASQNIPGGSFKESILSQIAHRFVLRLNDGNDAADILNQSRGRLSELSGLHGLSFYGVSEYSFVEKFRVAYAGDDATLDKTLEKLKQKYASFPQRAIMVGDASPFYYDAENLSFGDSNTFIGKCNFQMPIGISVLDDCPIAVSFNRHNPMLVIAGDYVKSKHIIATIAMQYSFLCSAAAKKGNGSIGEQLYFVDCCKSGEMIQRDNPLDDLLREWGEMKAEGNNSPVDYFIVSDKGNDFKEMIEKLYDVMQKRQYSKPDFAPIIVFILCSELLSKKWFDIRFDPLDHDDDSASSRFLELLENGRHNGIYFVFQTETLELFGLENHFSPSNTEFILLSDGSVENYSKLDESKTQADMRSYIERLRFIGVLDGDVRTKMIERDEFSDESKSNPALACLVRNKGISKFRFAIHQKGITIHNYLRRMKK